MKTITFDPGSLSQEGRSFRDRFVGKFLQYRTGAVVFESKAMAHDHERTILWQLCVMRHSDLFQRFNEFA